MSKRKIDAIEEVVEEEGKEGKKEFKEEVHDEEMLCAMCHDPVGSVNCCTTACNHQFHLTCMFKARRVNNNCPICREQLETDLPIIPNQGEEEGDEYNSDSEAEDEEEEALLEEQRREILEEALEEQRREILKNKGVCIYVLPAGSQRNEFPSERDLKASSLCSCLIEINSSEITLCRHGVGSDVSTGWRLQQSELWDDGPPKALFDAGLQRILTLLDENVDPIRHQAGSVVLFEASETVDLANMNEALLRYLQLSQEEADAVHPYF